MRVLIIGGAGMVGQKLANRLAGDASWTGKINELILYDVVSAQKPGAAFAIKTMTGSQPMLHSLKHLQLLSRISFFI